MLSSKAGDISEYHQYTILSSVGTTVLLWSCMPNFIYLVSITHPFTIDNCIYFLCALSTSLKIQSTTMNGTKSPPYTFFIVINCYTCTSQHRKKDLSLLWFHCEFQIYAVFIFLENGPKCLMTHHALNRFLSNQMPDRKRMTQPLRLTSISKWFMASM